MGRVFKQGFWSTLLVAAISLVFWTIALAHGTWPDGPNKQWLEGLQRPDNDQHPYRRSDPKSLSCCGAWYAWLKDSWVRIPPDKIVQDHAPDGQPYLFMLAGTVQCFVRPKGGL